VPAPKRLHFRRCQPQKAEGNFHTPVRFPYKHLLLAVNREYAIIRSQVRKVQSVAEKAACRGIFRRSLRGIRLEPSLQRRSFSASASHLSGCREPVRKLPTMRWGLIPSWAKDPSIGYKAINENPFKSQRCLIPADGFVNRGELFAFAGLWNRWTNPQGG